MKKVLYLTLVRSRVTYCSPIWRPQLLKDITVFEKMQRRATKYILNDFSSNYKNCLVTLQILPLMMVFEMMDILFFVSCLKYPSSHFNILQFVTFTTSSIRSSGCGKLEHYLPKTNRETFLFPSVTSSLEFHSCCQHPRFVKVYQKKIVSFFMEPLLSSLQSRYPLFLSLCLSLLRLLWQTCLYQL